MATFREIAYMILDEIKSINGDSYITEEHVLFLANQYRLFLIQLKINKEGLSSLSSSNELTICLDLEAINASLHNPCDGQLLRSILEVPDTVNGTTPSIFPYNFFITNIAIVSKDRIKFVGHNKYMQNIIYGCIHNNRLYLKSSNPLFIYLEKVKVTGIFEDAEKAAELSCSENSSDECIEALDTEFPLEGSLIPLMIELLAKELLLAYYRPKDDLNNSNDDIADIVAYVRRNMKSALAKLITE